MGHRRFLEATRGVEFVGSARKSKTETAFPFAWSKRSLATISLRHDDRFHQKRRRVRLGNGDTTSIDGTPVEAGRVAASSPEDDHGLECPLDPCRTHGRTVTRVGVPGTHNSTTDGSPVFQVVATIFFSRNSQAWRTICIVGVGSTKRQESCRIYPAEDNRTWHRK